MNDGIHDGDQVAFRRKTILMFTCLEKDIGDLRFRCSSCPEVAKPLKAASDAVVAALSALETLYPVRK